ncbi:hypothetical protein [Kingella potus]|uniref:hypothetical protein n=1 Tax=Kingella potus TaxID=265175 RepID=UPI000E1C2738|nr:hypothetical protein [Kingella potus]UOP01744.1 hypothetical protein LVJ84_06425 [Kingella potus]
MGYQVSNTCYQTREAAENVYFSSVFPVITDNGVKQINYTGNGWYYGSQKLQAHLPECDPAQNYTAGYELMIALLPTAVVLFAAKVIIKLLGWKW